MLDPFLAAHILLFFFCNNMYQHKIEMVISTNEYLSTIPLTILAATYWLRDKFLYNRVGESWYSMSIIQKKVLFFIYPTWIFMEWVTGLQSNRGEIGLALVSTTGKFIVGHYTIVGVLNDSFCMTRTQLYSMFLGLLLSYTWTVFYATLVSGRIATPVLE